MFFLLPINLSGKTQEVKTCYDQKLYDIGYEITVPEINGGIAGHHPQNGDDGQRECERDEQRHAVVLVELIDNHHHVDVAERDEAEGEDAQGVNGLGSVLEYCAAGGC